MIAARNIQIPRYSAWKSGRSGLAKSFADTPRRETVHEWLGDTDDIIRVIMHVVNRNDLQYQVQTFARDFRGRSEAVQYDLLHDLWAFCRQNIRYQADAGGTQDIKHPIAIYEDGFCDCKGMTILIYHTCKAIGLPAYIEFASYDGAPVGHVYPVAILSGQPVYLDAVFDEYDDIEDPVFTLKKYPNSYRSISGIPKPGPAPVACKYYGPMPNYFAL